MPVAVHQILVHRAAVVDPLLPLPLGMLSEEAQEARNKDIRPIVSTTPGRTRGSIQSCSGTYLMATSDDGNEVGHLSTIRPPTQKSMATSLPVA